MEHRDQLDQLLESVPFSDHWRLADSFVDSVDVVGLTVRMVGLCATHPTCADLVTGSAAQLEGSPMVRAFFELVERLSTLDAISDDRGAWTTFDRSHLPVGAIGRDQLFQQSSDPARARFSRSNGVACGASWADACRAAERELAERDLVLRSWLGAVRIQPVAPRGTWGSAPIADAYDVKAACVGEPRWDRVHVAAVVAFPRRPDLPLGIGFGGGDDGRGALERAAQECLQRVAFLWGEEPPRSQPTFAPTPDYHQETYQWPMSWARLRAWIGGEKVPADGVLASELAADVEEPCFVDLTPPSLCGRLSVVRAVSHGCLPLVFGEFPGMTPENGVHPVA